MPILSFTNSLLHLIRVKLQFFYSIFRKLEASRHPTVGTSFGGFSDHVIRISIPPQPRHEITDDSATTTTSTVISSK
jgi:hypothetical protein